MLDAIIFCHGNNLFMTKPMIKKDAQIVSLQDVKQYLALVIAKMNTCCLAGAGKGKDPIIKNDTHRGERDGAGWIREHALIYHEEFGMYGEEMTAAFIGDRSADG